VQGVDFAAIRTQLVAGSAALEEVVDFVVANTNRTSARRVRRAACST
jgi:hypothetical protein